MNAIVPPSSPFNKRLAGEPLAFWVRGVLAVMALALTAIFVTAWCINPYNPDGSAQRMATRPEAPTTLSHAAQPHDKDGVVVRGGPGPVDHL